VREFPKRFDYGVWKGAEPFQSYFCQHADKHLTAHGKTLENGVLKSDSGLKIMRLYFNIKRF